jgi:hypothetical protein
MNIPIWQKELHRKQNNGFCRMTGNPEAVPPEVGFWEVPIQATSENRDSVGKWVDPRGPSLWIVAFG